MMTMPEDCIHPLRNYELITVAGCVSLREDALGGSSGSNCEMTVPQTLSCDNNDDDNKNNHCGGAGVQDVLTPLNCTLYFCLL